MQERMLEVQQGLATKVTEATSGGGMVTVKINGNQEVISIKLDPAVVDDSDIEMLEDLIVAALNEATKKSKEMAASEMGKVTGGLGGMDIPGGLGGLF